jgi:hypothetical protein
VEGTVDVSFLFFGGSLFAEHFVTSKNGINRQLSDFLLIKQRQRDKEKSSSSDVMTLGLSKKLRSEAILIALISSCCRVQVESVQVQEIICSQRIKRQRFRNVTNLCISK